MMFFAAGLALLAAMMLMLVRLFLGPSLYDRVLALNAFGTKTVLLIGVVGFVTDRPDFMDIALLYALINFVSTIAILKFFRYRALGDITEGASSADHADIVGLEKPNPQREPGQ